MAKVKYTAFLADMRNSIANTTFSKNRGGSYSKNKSIPSNPQTSYQTAYRSKFATITSAWKGLSNAQRNVWENAVDNWLRTDIFGDVRTPSGFALYMRLNLQILRVDGAAISLPPMPKQVPPLVSMTMDMDSAGFFYTATLSNPINCSEWAGVFRATKSVSQGVSYVKNLFTDMVFDNRHGAVSDFDFTSAFQAKYGLAALDDKVFGQLWRVSKVTGQAYLSAQSSCIVHP